MKSSALVAAAVILFGTAAHAQTAGVAVQVSVGKGIPTIAQLTTVLRPGGFVRDILGWHKADPSCNLRSDPSASITIPLRQGVLYQNVEAAAGRNFVTLGFNNKRCGQPAVSGAVAFPNTPELRAEFAAYAVGVVQKVPALGGLSIWNELNGTWSGGYKDRAQQLTDYCLLANAVIADVRKVNAHLPIAIGATVGANIDQWVIDMFDTYGCMGKGDPTIWLDVHPYLSGKHDAVLRQTDWQIWSNSIRNVRADGITNPLIATEWGARAAYLWTQAHPRSSYMKVFRTRVLAQDPAWAGFIWFEMLYDKAAPNAGLFDSTGSLTGFGMQYVKEFAQ
jgi:hypothetical protein